MSAAATKINSQEYTLTPSKESKLEASIRKQLGKENPYSTDAEQAVIGAMLIDVDAYHVIEGTLEFTDFYFMEHQYVFRAARDLAKAGKPIDIVLVTEQLRKMKKLDAVGGAWYLVECSNKVVLSSNIKTHADLVHSFSSRRKLIKRAVKATKDALDPSKSIEETYDYIHEATMFGSDNGFFVTESMNQSIARAAVEPERKNILGPLIKTGQMGFIYATHGVGKTVFAIQVANALSRGHEVFPCLPNHTDAHGVILVDMEMTGQDLYGRYSNNESIYEFDDNLIRMRPNHENYGKRYHDRTAACFKNIRQTLKKNPHVQTIIIDNLTAISQENISDATVAAQAIQEIAYLKHVLGLTVIIIGHIPKMPASEPMTSHSMRGSGLFGNLVDFMIGMNHVVDRKGEVYIIQNKGRGHGSDAFAKDNVIKCQIERRGREGEFLQMTYLENCAEQDCLSPFLAQEAQDSFMEQAIQLNIEGMSWRKIKDQLNWPQGHDYLRSKCVTYVTKGEGVQYELQIANGKNIFKKKPDALPFVDDNSDMQPTADADLNTDTPF